jgi:hypothetical protein
MTGGVGHLPGCIAGAFPAGVGHYMPHVPGVAEIDDAEGEQHQDGKNDGNLPRLLDFSKAGKPSRLNCQ